MIILHIAEISNNKCDGVCVVVPQHIIAQAENNTVGLINLKDEIIDKNFQLEYKNPFNIRELKKPFNKPDIVVFHGCYRSKYLAISKKLNDNKIPYIIIPHGELREEAQRKKIVKKKLANLILFNKFIKLSRGIQCLSKEEYINTKFKNCNKFIATNGIDLPSRKKGRFNKSIIKLIYIGRLELNSKGLDLMIQAIKNNKTLIKNNNCVLDIYGPDIKGRYNKLEKIIKNNGVDDIVKLHHEITGEEKEKVLLDSDIFIQTSRHEGMPLGILEALSYGIPCLVTKGTNLGNDIRNYNAGWYSENNSMSITSAIESAINERNKWSQYSKNAIQLIEENYAWNIISKKTTDLYKKMIKEI